MRSIDIQGSKLLTDRLHIFNIDDLVELLASNIAKLFNLGPGMMSDLTLNLLEPVNKISLISIIYHYIDDHISQSRSFITPVEKLSLTPEKQITKELMAIINRLTEDNSEYKGIFETLAKTISTSKLEDKEVKNFTLEKHVENSCYYLLDDTFMEIDSFILPLILEDKWRHVFLRCTFTKIYIKLGEDFRIEWFNENYKPKES